MLFASVDMRWERKRMKALRGRGIWPVLEFWDAGRGDELPRAGDDPAALAGDRVAASESGVMGGAKVKVNSTGFSTTNWSMVYGRLPASGGYVLA